MRTSSTRWTIGFGAYQTVATVARKGSQEILAPHLSIFGAGTAAEFYGSLGANDISNGLFNRLTILKASKRERNPNSVANAYREPPQELLNRLRAIVPDEPVFMPRHVASPTLIPWASSKVEKAYDDFEDTVYARLQQDTELEPYASRVAEQGLRLMTIRAVSRDGRNARVTMDDLKWGLSFAANSAEIAISDIRENVAASDFAARVKCIKGHLEELFRKTPEVSQTVLSKRVKGRYRPRDIQEAIQSLEDEGWLQVNNQETSGRPLRTYSKARN